jgi:E3 Ubiquitin ligase
LPKVGRRAESLIPIELICSAFGFSVLLVRASDSRPIAWCIVGAFAGLFIFYKGFLLLEKRHLILNTPASKIRSASLGMVELSGLAAGPYTMVAPITERTCYYYRTEAWEWKQSGRSKTWVKVAAECAHVPFFLDDNTGKVMVDPRGAELDLHRDFQQEFCDGLFTTKQAAPPNVLRFLLRHGVSTRNKIKVEEFCIKPKNAMFVLGTLDENPGIAVTSQPIPDLEFSTHTTGLSFSLGSSPSSVTASSLRFGNSIAGFGLSGKPSAKSEDERLLEALSNNAPPAKLAKSPAASCAANPWGAKSAQVIQLSPASGPVAADAMTQQQQVAAALMKAGITNPAAWTAAGVTPSGTAVGAQASSSAPNPANPTAQQSAVLDQFDQHPRSVLMKGKNNPTFLISWRSQLELARSLGWKSTLMIWGGPGLTLFCLYGLQSMTHWF